MEPASPAGIVTHAMTASYTCRQAGSSESLDALRLPAGRQVLCPDVHRDGLCNIRANRRVGSLVLTMSFPGGADGLDVGQGHVLAGAGVEHQAAVQPACPATCDELPLALPSTSSGPEPVDGSLRAEDRAEDSRVKPRRRRACPPTCDEPRRVKSLGDEGGPALRSPLRDEGGSPFSRQPCIRPGLAPTFLTFSGSFKNLPFCFPVFTSSGP